MDKPHFLHTVFKPEKFNREELQIVLTQFEKVELKKNEFLIKNGQVANNYFLLELGYLRSYVLDSIGNNITTNFFSQRDLIIDWDSYFHNMKCKESIQAITNCRCWKISRSKAIKLSTIDSFQEVNRLLLVKNHLKLKNHLDLVLSNSAKQRYLKLVKEKPILARNVPLKHIATYLGITDTSLSRIRKEISL